MLAKSGIGYNHTTKMIAANKEDWNAYVKINPSAKFMRFKSWPFYDDWCEIFGKDRATRENATGFVDVVTQVLNEPNQEHVQEEADDVFDGFNKFFKGLKETAEIMSDCQPTSSVVAKAQTRQPAPTESQPGSSATGKAKSGRKRKSMDTSYTVCDLLGKFCKNTNARLGDIAKRIGYEYDISNARKEVWAFVDTIEGMNLSEKLLVSKLLVKDTEDLEFFFILLPHAKEAFAKMKLSGNL